MYIYINQFIHIRQSIETLYVAEIEVYEYPDDCVVDELIDHFSDKPYLASSTTPHHQMQDEDTGNFVMEFPAAGGCNTQVISHYLCSHADLSCETVSVTELAQ